MKPLGEVIQYADDSQLCISIPSGADDVLIQCLFQSGWGGAILFQDYWKSHKNILFKADQFTTVLANSSR